MPEWYAKGEAKKVKVKLPYQMVYEQWLPAIVEGNQVEVLFHGQLKCLFFRTPGSRLERKFDISNLRTASSDHPSLSKQVRLLLHGHSLWSFEVDFSRAGVESLVSASAASQSVIDYKAPMAGQLLKLCVKEGDVVEKGQLVFVVEAMKMENQILAPVSGKISKLVCAQGDKVASGQKLFRMEKM